jgi:hypothetical protein
MYTLLHDDAKPLSITVQPNLTSSTDTSLSHGVKILVSFGVYQQYTRVKTQVLTSEFSDPACVLGS